jgi:D-arabinose 1-dehydrogenase-like Zn-dependent alcohol dehydrogenase
MKAVVVPAMNSSWPVEDVPQLQPGPSQVLVKMHASGICYTDVHETLGHIPGQFSDGKNTRRASERASQRWAGFYDGP